MQTLIVPVLLPVLHSLSVSGVDCHLITYMHRVKSSNFDVIGVREITTVDSTTAVAAAVIDTGQFRMATGWMSVVKEGQLMILCM